MDAIRVVLADEHPIVGAGMHILEQAQHLFNDLAPDVLLIEMTLDDDPGDSDCRSQAAPIAAPRVFVLHGHHNHEYVFGLLIDESDKALSKHDALQMIAAAIQSELAGDVSPQRHRVGANVLARQLADQQATMPKFTTREVEVLRQLSTGASDQAIGEHLGVSTSTIRYHLQHIYRKLGITRRSEAVVWAIQAGWAEPER